MKRLLFFCALSCYSLIAFSQGWIAGNGITNQAVRALIAYNGDTLLAGVDNNGVYISYDNGVNWAAHALSNQSIQSLIKVGDLVLAGTDGNGIFKNNSLAGTWQNVPVSNQSIYSFTQYNDTLYIGTSGTMGPGAIYQSLDTGNTWSQYLSGFPYAFLQIAINPNNNRLLTATPFGAFYSDNQNSLTATSGFNGTIRTVTHLNGDTIIYGTDLGTYISYNNGVSGQVLSNQGSGPIFSIDDTIYQEGFRNLIYNSDINSTWQFMPINNPSNRLPNSPLSLVKNNQRFIAGTFTGIYFYSSSLTVGVNEIDIPEQEFLLSPNPNHGAFSLKVEESESDFTVRLFNNHGKLISKQLCSSSKGMTFDFDIPSGIYFLKIETEGKSLGSIKFIVL